jgi:hypothetical protein
MDLTQWLSYSTGERFFRLLSALAPPGESAAISETKKSHNVMTLPFGDASPFQLNAPFGQVFSLASEVVCNKPVQIQATTTITGVTFVTGESLGVYTPVLVNKNAKCVFRNCTFVKQSGHVDQAMVTVSGAATKAVFVGCTFVRDGGLAPNAVTNLTGTAGNVQIVGCMRAGYSSFGSTAAPIGSIS